MTSHSCPTSPAIHPPLQTWRGRVGGGICLAFLLAVSLNASAQEDKATRTMAKANRMMAKENLGGIKIDMHEKNLITLIGAPESKGALEFQGGTEVYLQELRYPSRGLAIIMTAGERKNGIKRVMNVMASEPSTLATARGIRVGSPEADARRAYAADAADRGESPATDGSFVAGSIYNGIRFTFARGAVTSIYFGAMAE